MLYTRIYNILIDTYEQSVGLPDQNPDLASPLRTDQAKASTPPQLGSTLAARKPGPDALLKGHT